MREVLISIGYFHSYLFFLFLVPISDLQIASFLELDCVLRHLCIYFFICFILEIYVNCLLTVESNIKFHEL